MIDWTDAGREWPPVEMIALISCWEETVVVGKWSFKLLSTYLPHDGNICHEHVNTHVSSPQVLFGGTVSQLTNYCSYLPTVFKNGTATFLSPAELPRTFFLSQPYRLLVMMLAFWIPDYYSLSHHFLHFDTASYVLLLIGNLYLLLVYKRGSQRIQTAICNN